ncbi:glycosyltransferase family 20 protein [Rickenella mellea]|uniref:Glycosyltransferase family 20 protein n=1 Tax=Rickenella mellea TaxID=50990 RepID=A0A4Y7QGY9_9AGAM|nr:glycosyltransferase family 20 protein [Rickenella mellea]
MSSFRNNRIVIASLFLPKTAAVGEDRRSGAPTPDENRFLALSGSANVPQPKSPLRKNFPGPLSSIVDDLAFKSKAPTPSISPAAEAGNPFTTFANLSAATQPLQDAATALLNATIAQTPPTSRKHQTTHTDSQGLQHRVSRKGARSSSSRRNGFDIKEWHIEANPHCNGGLNNAVNSVGSKMKRKLWVGVLGTQTDGFNKDLRDNINKRMRVEAESVPVWIPDSEFSKCYDEFCHQVLWPCLHYAIPDAPKTKLFYESASYQQYVAVNQKFADVIVENYQEGDIIWVNDYHLMLLPSLLRAKLPNAPIGFFLHVAFPSSEIFRCLSVRQKLLRGMLAADLIGFQTANFARHFRQTVSRILSYEALPKGIQTPERFVDVAVFPIGIDVASLTMKRRDPEVTEWVNLLHQRYAGMKLIVGRDKLDEVQGVRQKLQAFEMFLEKYPDFRGKIVLIQVALSTTEENEAQGGVADIVARINSRYSSLTYQPVVFLHTNDLTFSQYLALLTVADAFIVTSLREGMALRTHEFVECQEGRARPLILSEFTGSYSYSGFRSCLPINPWDARMTSQAIYQALTMSDFEAEARWKDLHNHVVTQTAQAFVTGFLTRCIRVHLEHENQLDGEGDKRVVQKLDVARVLPRYKHSRQRLLLIDLEATLWLRDPLVKGTSPPKEAIDVLNALAEDVRNNVWILSGLRKSGVLDEIAKAVPKVGLVAENGCFIKPRPVAGKPQPWINMVSNFNLSWKPSCLEILDYFAERTPNSFVEEREASIVWRFWTGSSDDSSDRQWARRQAAEAQNHIFDSLGEKYGLRIIPGKNSFLVLPNNVSRSSAVGAILAPGGPVHTPISMRPPWLSTLDTETDLTTDIDFVLAVSGDEKLLRRLNELDHAETVSTSDSGTDARWKLEPKDTVGTLSQFAKTA